MRLSEARNGTMNHSLRYIPKRVNLLVVFVILAGLNSLRAQGFDPGLANQLQAKIDSIRVANNVKGMSVCIIHPKQGLWTGVSGISKPGTPISDKMIFGIGSNTKLFTGVLLLKLVENKLLDLDDPIGKYLPRIQYVDSAITVRQLLNHTSGLMDVLQVPGYNDSVMANPNRVFSTMELMRWLGPPNFQPGKGWEYCNTNYLLGGLIAENITKRPYAKLLRDSILRPLNMDSTFLDVYDSLSVAVANPWQAGVNNMGVPRKSVNSAAWSAGAMYSTSREMAQWYQSLMGGKVINPSSMKELTTFVGSGNYGIGIAKSTINGKTIWYHGGTIWGGYNSSMMYDPSSQSVVCVLINQLPAQAYQVAIQLLATLDQYATVVQRDMPKSLLLYPNPSLSSPKIHLPKEAQARVRVFDTKGQLMIETMDSELEVSQWPKGQYLIYLESMYNISVQRLILN